MLEGTQYADRDVQFEYGNAQMKAQLKADNPAYRSTRRRKIWLGPISTEGTNIGRKAGGRKSTSAIAKTTWVE